MRANSTREIEIVSPLSDSFSASNDMPQSATVRDGNGLFNSPHESKDHVQKIIPQLEMCGDHFSPDSLHSSMDLLGMAAEGLYIIACIHGIYLFFSF